MRIRHSLKAIVPLFLTLAGQLAFGQGAAPPTSVPPGFLPSPGSGSPYSSGSVFDPRFSQTYNDAGMWFQNSRNGFGPNNRARKPFLNLDYTYSSTRNLSGILGNSSSQSYYQQNDPDSDGIVDDLAYFRYMDPARGAFIPELNTHGMKASGGWWNVDGSGFLMDIGWQVDATSTYDARAGVMSQRIDTATALALASNGGNAIAKPFTTNGGSDLGLTLGFILAPGVPFDDTDSVEYGAWGTTFSILDRTLLNLHGIPIDDGSLLGATIPYDLQFRMQHSLTTLGSSGAFAFAPIRNSGGIRINPTFGGRYQKVKENFAFFGADSGLAYIGSGDDDTPENAKVFPPYDGIDDDDDFIADNLAEDTDPEFVQINPFDPVMVRAYHQSEVVSNLAGPEFGFNYRFGDEDEGISILGFSKFALMFNNEQVRVFGDNLFNHMSIADTPDPVTGLFPALDGFDTNNLNGPSANAYSSSSSTVHLSPLFEQSLVAEIPLFNRVPVLSDVRILDGAKLRLGWTFLIIGEIADPLQSVQYTSNPQLNMFPKARSRRDTFSQHTLNAGLSWTY